MSGVQILRIGADEGEQRIDRWLKKRFPQLTQGAVEKMCRTGQLRVDGGRVKANTRIEAGQEIRIPPIPDGEAPAPTPKARVKQSDAEMIQSCVLWRDEHIIALNKPPGLPSQGGSGQGDRHVDGLTEALMFGYKDRPKLVHRLDKDTSGVLLLARTDRIARALSEAFRHRLTRKIYWAAVAGVPHPRMGSIKYGLVKAPGRGRMGEGEKMVAVHPSEVATTEGASAPIPTTPCCRRLAAGSVGPPWCRSPAAPTSCAPIWPRSATRSSATANMAARGRRTWATAGAPSWAARSAASCTCTPG